MAYYKNAEIAPNEKNTEIKLANLINSAEKPERLRFRPS